MKKTAILIFCLLAINLNSSRLYFDYDLNLESIYSNNVLKLSVYDLDRFENNYNDDKFKLKTTDDLINSARFRMEIKNYFVYRHTQKHEIFLKYNSYLKNSFLNDGFLGYRFTQYLNRQLNFNLSYFYYPFIYVNRYHSEVDGLDIYRDFTYAKNDYQAQVNWKAIDFLNLSYQFGYGQYYYNKYFTEYDAESFDHRIIANLLPRSKIRPTIYYEYRIAKAKGEHAFDDPSDIETIKDFSYDANRYNLALTIPRLWKIGKRHLYFSSSLHYEQRYFQYDEVDDAYHYCREDYTFTANGAVSYRILDNTGVRLSGKYQKRNTRSPFSNVRRDKNYDLLELALRISYRF